MLFLIKSHFSLSKVSRIHSEIKGGGSVTVLAKINGRNFSLHLSLPQLVLRPMGISNTFLSNWNFQIESIQWMRFSFIVLIQFGWTLGKYFQKMHKKNLFTINQSPKITGSKKSGKIRNSGKIRIFWEFLTVGIHNMWLIIYKWGTCVIVSNTGMNLDQIPRSWAAGARSAV